MFNLAERTIFIALGGSHAHGTAREGSDVDIRGVCIAPLSVRVSPFREFEQYDGPIGREIQGLIEKRLMRHPTASEGAAVKMEGVVFDIAKFVKLCAAANPNALEILFADETDWLYASDPWREIHIHRHELLSKKVQQTYLGYALAQLKRIKSHRSWLLDPPKKKPMRKDFGLPERGTLSQDDRHQIEQSVAETLRQWSIDTLEMPKPARIALKEKLRTFLMEQLRVPEEQLDDGLRTAAAKCLGLPRALVEVLHAERRYRAALKHWESYARWKAERNPERSKLESKFGYDTKHATHLLRLMRTGLEVLSTGDLRVRREDASELNAIRDGALSYDEMVAVAERLQARLIQVAEHSPLPDDIDYDRLEALVTRLIRAVDT